MVNNIINGVSSCIYEHYGNGYRIYRENIEQGLKEPCFFIALVEAMQERIIGNRYKLTVALDVHYFPSDKEKNKEMQTVAQQLHHILQRITLLDGDMLNGFNLRWETVEDVLHFFVTYKSIVYYDMAEDALMEDLFLESKTKEGDRIGS